MNDLQGLGSNGAEAAEERHRERREQTFPLTVPKPIIAAINGPVAGIGLVQALMCDLRFAAAGAKVTTAFARRGLIAEHGISWVLPRLIGPSRALDLLFSARVLMTDEAAEMGLVNRVVPADRLMDETLEYARDLAANCSPASLAVMKAQIYGDLDRPLDEALERANGLMMKSFTRPDFKEGVASFVERRPPDFAPLTPH
jgi:enoyl-CoA hydratase/carnithine racemase